MADAKRQKTEGSEKGPKAPSRASPSDEELMKIVETLEQVQGELEEVEEKASEEILKIEQKFKGVRDPIVEKRRQIAAKIPDFWTTVLTNHAIFFSCLTEEDHRVLEHLQEVDVQEKPDISSGHTISMRFEKNPWFENEVLTKTFNFSNEGTVKVTGTTIRWKPGKDITKKTKSEKPRKTEEQEEESEESFFHWFDTPEVEVEEEELDDGIAEVIRDEIWPNPLKFFTQEDEEEEEGEEGEDGDEEEGEEGDEEEEDAEDVDDGDAE